MKGRILTQLQYNQLCKQYDNYTLTAIKLKSENYFIFEEQLSIKEIDSIKLQLEALPIIELTQEDFIAPINNET